MLSKFAYSVLRFVIGSIILSAIVNASIWYFWGKTKIIATVDGETVNSWVMLDGRRMGKTPIEMRLLPGYHRITVQPPYDAETNEPDITNHLFTIVLGTQIEANFTAPQGDSVLIQPETF